MPADIVYLASKSAVLGGAGSGTAATPFLDAAGNQVIIPFLGSSKMDCQPFRLQCAGKCTGGASAITFTASIYWGAVTVNKPLTISATASNNVVLEATAGQVVTSTTGSFYIQFIGIWESTVGQITGCGMSLESIGTVFTTWTVLNADPTAVTTLNTDAPQGYAFVPFGTFSAAQAANAAYVTKFSLELL